MTTATRPANPVCGWHAHTGPHLVPFGHEAITSSGVSQRQVLRRAIDMAQADLADDPDAVRADIAAAERMFTLSLVPGTGGAMCVSVDDETFAAAQRLIADAIEYAVVNDYDDDYEDMNDATDRFLGSETVDVSIARLWCVNR